ncbi:PLC-like phosphodiesterase [Mariannaea sp. PMI_226]|nr:PLC-like phosphodiesterase [Mariannaea sp. PMI_226]
MRQVPPLSDWMKEIPGDYNISQLTIPGTHDSHATSDKITQGLEDRGALIGSPLVLRPLAQCQDIEIWQQFNNGVRYFDLRVSSRRSFGGSDVQYGLCHASIPLSENLAVVLGGMDVFLRNHNKETILVSIKWDEERFETNFTSTSIPEDHNLRLDVAAHWTKFGWYSGTTWPKLDEVRGKAILLRRFYNPPGEDFGIDITNFWSEKEKLWGNGMWRQIDRPSESGLPKEGRWARTHQQLLAAKSSNFNDQVMHFTSMADARIQAFDLLTPRDYAGFLNPVLRRWLGNNENTNPRSNRFGIIITDFCCHETALQVVKMNFTN